MSRTFTRAAPLPEPFALPATVAAASALHRRVVFLALPDDPPARALGRSLAAVPGVVLAPGPSRLFARGLRHAWETFPAESDVGLSQLASGEEFLTALRALADSLLAPTVTGARVLVEHTPGHADPGAVRAIRSVYPDAAVVVRRELAAALPTAEAAGLLVDAAAVEVLTRLGGGARQSPATPPQPGGAPPVVVVGAGRSGTTWLERLLMVHPELGGVPLKESWIFEQLAPLWTSYEADPRGLASWVDAAAFRAAVRAFCDQMFAAALARFSPGARIFVEKTPVHSFHLARVAELYPQASVIHLLRDGRDVARSMAQVPFFNIPDEPAGAALWARTIAAVRADSSRFPRYRELRYEDLYADPGARVAELWRWLGLPVDPSTRAALTAAAGERVSAHAGSAPTLGPGSWRTLPAIALAGVYRAAGSELVAEGYARRRDVWQARLRGRLARFVRGGR